MNLITTPLQCVFIDPQNTFDTTDHDILLHMFYYYGIRGVAIDWFRSYLTSRKQIKSNQIKSIFSHKLTNNK